MSLLIFEIVLDEIKFIWTMVTTAISDCGYNGGKRTSSTTSCKLEFLIGLRKLFELTSRGTTLILQRFLFAGRIRCDMVNCYI